MVFPDYIHAALKYLIYLGLSQYDRQHPMKYLLLLLLPVLTSCSSKPSNSSAGYNVKLADTDSKPKRNPKEFIPNEMGQVMVLEYHLIGYPEDTWRRTPENFRKDLQMLYDHNFYPVSVLDIAKDRLDIPAGMTPFALTFDDSSAGQFRYLEKNGKLEIDPDCAVGIIESFKKKYADFPLTASFYVLPAIKPSLRLFAQPEYQQQKLTWLAEKGYEIGNHGWYHVPLHKLDDTGVQKHLAMFVKEIQKFIPNYQVRTLALPLGMHAKNRKLESQGTFEGTSYRHEAVLLVGSATSVSPQDPSFNPLAIQRVQAGDTPTGPEAFRKRQDKNKIRYISDGIAAPSQAK